MPEHIAKLQVNCTGTVGKSLHAKNWRIENGYGVTSERPPDLQKTGNIFAVYATSEMDNKLAELSENVFKKLDKDVNEIRNCLPQDIAQGIEPHMSALFESFKSAKAELTKAVIDSVRKDLNRLVEDEVRRILPDLLQNEGGQP